MTPLRTRFQRLGLRSKIMLPVSVVAFLLGVLGTVLIHRTETRNEDRDLCERAATLARSVAYLSGLTDNPVTLRRYVATLATEPGVERVLVARAHDARVVASSRLRDVGLPLGETSGLGIETRDVQVAMQTHAPFVSRLGGEDQVVYAMPIRLRAMSVAEGGDRGLVAVRLDRSGVAAARWQVTFWHTAGEVVIVVLLSLVAFLTFRGVVLVRLHRIGEVIDGFAQGDTTRRVDDSVQDELGRLGSSLDRMLHDLLLAQHELIEERDLQEHQAITLATQKAELQASESQFRSLVNNIPGVTYRFELGGKEAHGYEVVFLSDAIEEITGYAAEEFFAGRQTILGLAHEDDRELLLAAVERSAKLGDPITVEYRLHHADGSLRWVREKGRPLRNEVTGEVLAFDGAIFDITERKASEQALAMKNRSLNDALEQIAAHKLALDEHAIVACTDRSGRITYVNQQFVQISGYSREELIGANHRMVNSGHHPKSFWVEMWKTIVSGRVWHGEVCNRTKDGSLYWVDTSIAPVRNADGEVDQFIAVRTDITQIKHYEQQLWTAARLDRLTALPNRALLHSRLQRAIDRYLDDAGRGFALMFLDFDRFKVINDSLGHDVGDELLIQISSRLRSVTAADDSLSDDVERTTVARLGGDEFVVLFKPASPEDDAEELGRRLLAALNRPYDLHGYEVVSTASIGLVYSDPVYRKAEDMISDADTAMYQAKGRGKACLVVFDQSMREAVQQRLLIENDLRTSIVNDELYLQYQPIVDLENGNVSGYEALVRWHHPARGFIGPDAFIPIAEETGFIHDLGAWVLRRACEEFMRWQASMGDRAPQSVAVNLSPKQLVAAGLVSQIRKTLEETGVPPAALRLEITESAVMHDVGYAAKVLGKLKETGIQLAMDDFGTGYSSLGSLQRLPFDILKIDRSFIQHLDTGVDLIALVQAVTQLASNLRIEIVAEGIETRDQVAILQSLDCTYGQGYYFSKPMNPELVSDFRVPREKGTWAHDAETAAA